METGMNRRHGEAFVARLQSAKRQFECGVAALNASSPAHFAQMAADAFVARKIARDAPTEVAAIGIDVNEFLRETKAIADIRNVAEHTDDVVNPRKASVHSHTTPEGLRIATDETGLVVLGPTRIFRGPLNLYDTYVYISNKLTEIDSRKEITPSSLPST